MGEENEELNWPKVEEVTLALLHLTSFKERGVVRAWTGHDWDVLNRLYNRGWISSPVTKAKSVVLSEEAAKLSGELFSQYFGRP